MSNRSSSSRESSPRRFRSRSPASETESVVSPGSWLGTSTTFHPSSYQTAASSPASLLRQPVGFGAGTAPTPSHHPVPSDHHPANDYSIKNYPTSRKNSSRGKDRDRLKDTKKDMSRKSKQRDKGSTGHAVDQHSHSQLLPEQPAADLPIQRTAFRVRSYTNDPTSGGSPYTIQQGPYGATYRAEVGTRVDNGRSQNTSQPRSHPRGRPAQSAVNAQSRSSYYRYDYDQLRESAPANRARQAASPTTMYHHHATPAYPESHACYTPSPTNNPDARHRSSHSTKRKETHPQNLTNRPSPAPPHYYSETYDPPAEHYDPAPVQHPPQYAPAPSTHAPTPDPSREKSHRRARSHRHEKSQAQYEFPLQPPPPAPQGDIPLPPPRVYRVLTLLIEDKRNDDSENMLTEVRVPLKEVGSGDVGFWADAQEVTEELQRGPSRIDGRAKVYTLRGKYKQYFLRISHDGEVTCQSANLKVAADRTLELFIEDNPPPANLFFAPPPSPPRIDRELLTPVTDSRDSLSPAPMPPSAHKRTSRSSLFSVDDLSSPSAEEQRCETASLSVSARKRPRSSSLQSVQSVNMESHSQLDSYRVSSPFAHRSPSIGPTADTQPRTSQASPSPRPPGRDPSTQLSPASPSADLSNPQPAGQHSQPVQATPTSSFPQAQRATSFTQPVSRPSPSSPKKPKLSVPQPLHRTEHSVSPGPSQPGTYPWSHSRTPSVSKEANLGFLSFANSIAPKLNLSASVSTPSPFSRYEASRFSLPTAQSEPSIIPASQSNLMLPSVTAPIVVPTIPSLSSVSFVPATVAPSAMSVLPTLSGQTNTELDNIVGKWIRSIICKEPGWETFVRNRSRILKMREQLEQYKYVQGIIDRYENTATPPDLEGAGGVQITKTQVMRAFNLGLAWGDECTDTLVLTGLYGPGGTRYDDPRVVKMLDEANPIATGMMARKYLALLREVDAQWTGSHSG